MVTSTSDISAPATRPAGLTDFSCRSCGNLVNNLALMVPGDPLDYTRRLDCWFRYAQCGGCGSLSLIDVPDDLSPYYGGDYYSHTSGGKMWLRTRLQKFLDRGRIFSHPKLARYLADRFPYAPLSELRPLISGQFRKTLHHDSSILDVGCGSGAWLFRLASLGFSNLTGVDPFLRKESKKPVRLLRANLEDVPGSYSLIYCSHALEHVESPKSSLIAMRQRLDDDGVILLRLPILNTYAWSEYGGYWVQLDAPRHLTLFTVDGIRSLASSIGLTVAKVEFDSTEFMDLGSLARQDNVFPHGPKDVWKKTLTNIEPKLRKALRKNTLQKNQLGTSDQAAFYLVRQ